MTNTDTETGAEAEALELSDLPDPEYEGPRPIDDLSVDGENPNEMNEELYDLLVRNLSRRGWLGGPIITTTDGLIADGEHRWRAAQQAGLTEVPVKEYDIDDDTRRLWRLELNKIRGTHDRKRDALELDHLFSTDKRSDVEELFSATDDSIDDLLDEIRIRSTPQAPEYEYEGDHDVYFMDCVEGMQEHLEENSVDLFLTDPPYATDGRGIQAQAADGTVGVENAAELTEYPEFEGNTGEFDFAEVWELMQEYGDTHIIFGGNYFTDILPPTNQWIIWDKRASRNIGGGHSWFSDAELAWTNTGQPVRIIEHKWQGMLRDGNEERFHPTQKPAGMLARLIENHTEPGDLVCDPFMGSGATAVAAIETGRDYIGFEIDGEWRDVIERRIQDASRQVQTPTNQSPDTDTPDDNEDA